MRKNIDMAKKSNNETDFQPKLWVRVHINFEGEKEYLPMCTIGVQTFMFGRPCETKQEAIWYLGCMKTALDNAIKCAKSPQLYPRPLKRLSLNKELTKKK